MIKRITKSSDGKTKVEVDGLRGVPFEPTKFPASNPHLKTIADYRVEYQRLRHELIEMNRDVTLYAEWAMARLAERDAIIHELLSVYPLRTVEKVLQRGFEEQRRWIPKGAKEAAR